MKLTHDSGVGRCLSIEEFPVESADFRRVCKRTLGEHGVLVMPNLLKSSTIESVLNDGEKNQHLAYSTANEHNIYLKPVDPNFPVSHVRNRQVSSSKGCITTDVGTLVLFRGRNSMHRVTPVVGDRTRMLTVLAYNTEPDISLSESATMTFYGRLGSSGRGR